MLQMAKQAAADYIESAENADTLNKNTNNGKLGSQTSLKDSRPSSKTDKNENERPSSQTKRPGSQASVKSNSRPGSKTSLNGSRPGSRTSQGSSGKRPGSKTSQGNQPSSKDEGQKADLKAEDEGEQHQEQQQQTQPKEEQQPEDQQPNEEQQQPTEEQPNKGEQPQEQQAKEEEQPQQQPQEQSQEQSQEQQFSPLEIRLKNVLGRYKAKSMPADDVVDVAKELVEILQAHDTWDNRACLDALKKITRVYFDYRSCRIRVGTLFVNMGFPGKHWQLQHSGRGWGM